jgi:hypothetical protein
MDDPDESVKLGMKAIRPETRRGQGAVDGEAGLGLEERCERVECGKSVRGRRIGGRRIPVSFLCLHAFTSFSVTITTSLSPPICVCVSSHGRPFLGFWVVTQL